ncbi:MAG: DUF1294 domain-containing protein [Alistipes sp.]|jgi:uncharacterized membrane protein YsdA (DUF1294 family)|nr:DUF1294 domain-containing protein [Alistipes sp.]MBQ5692884.1 DUF1294 domain-containing protein [Alistipes sp.]
MSKVAIYYLAAINVIAFILYGLDKLWAKKGRWRVPERSLILIAAAGGSIGAIAAMKVWHHKTKHNKFRLGLPAILLAQIALIYFAVYR